MTETVAGIEYSKPTVTILQSTGLGVSEIAARTCYDSFEASENFCIQDFNTYKGKNFDTVIEECNEIPSSELLTSLAWVHHHHSILEHTNISFHIQGTSRGVLQEFARHRMQAISVRSTRYTMQDILHAFNSAYEFNKCSAKFAFRSLTLDSSLFIINGIASRMETDTLFDKLDYQRSILGKSAFLDITMSKGAKAVYDMHDFTKHPVNLQTKLLNCKSKRNVGDSFKWMVTDNWKVDLVSTMNLRALKNFLTLRDSGAAYFQIRHVAQAMKEALPSKYLDLIVKA